MLQLADRTLINDVSDDANRIQLPDTGLRSPTVAVMGLGYVGLPTSLALAENGCKVIGIDINEARLADVRANRADVLPEDRERLARALISSRLLLTSNWSSLRQADIVLICVPTPVDRHLVPAIAALRSACDAAVAAARRGQVLVLTSTAYVGATRELLANPLRDQGFLPGDDIYVAFSPERIDPGNRAYPQGAVPRLVGGVTRRCTAMAGALLSRIAAVVHPMSSPEAAELAKLHENTFRAVNVALANEMAEISSGFGLDVVEIIEGASTKPFGFMPFYPGPGVGGHCIPCDPHYLTWQLRAMDVQSPLINVAMSQLATRPRRIVERAQEELGRAFRATRGARVILAGVTYKPNVADIRQSPALVILDLLVKAGADVAYYDPLVPKLTLPNATTLQGTTCPDGSQYDLVVVHTVHRQGDYDWVAKCPNVLDASYRLSGIGHRVLP